MGSFSYTSSVALIFIRGVSLTHPELASFLCGEFLLHIPCWLLSFFLLLLLFLYIFIWGVSLIHSMLASFLSGEFLLHIPCWLLYYVPSFSYTSRGDFFFICGVSLTHPVLASLVGSFSYTSCAGFFIWGVSLTHPVLASSCGEFLLHVPCWLYNLGSFSYTSFAGFLMLGVSLTCPLEAGGCFMVGFCLTHDVCVLTIPTAYQRTKYE